VACGSKVGCVGRKMGGVFCLEGRRETWEMEILFLSMARYSFSEFDVHSL